MRGSKWVSCLCLIGLLFLAGCSDDDSVSPEFVIESQVEQLMQIVIPTVTALNPFNAPPLKAGDSTLGGVECVDIDDPDQPFCGDGTVEQCGEDTVVFTQCDFEFAEAMFLVDGSLVYSPKSDWPTGTRTTTITSPVETTVYEFDFDGTDQLDVLVSSDTLMASCVADLVTGQATCEIV